MKYGTNQANGITLGRIAKYHDVGVRFYCLTSLQQDFTVKQSLFFASGQDSTMNITQPPTWHSKVGVSSTYLLKQEGFVVDDDELEDGDILASGQIKQSHHWKSRTSVTQRAHWTIGLEHIAGQICHEGPQAATQMTQALTSVETTLRGSRLDRGLPIRTVFDSCPGDIAVQDVDEASTQLEELVLAASQVTEDDERSDEPRLKLTTIALPHSLPLRRFANDMDLSHLYDQMIGEWVSTLSPNTPGRIRTSKAKELLQAASEMTLAVRVFQFEHPQEPAEDIETQPTNQLELPVRRGPSPSPSTPSIYIDASSQLPSQTSSRADFSSAPPSQITTSTRSSALLAPRITRMSRYTTFSHPAVPLPRSMETVLAHWDTSADPNSYDWLATTRHLARRRDAEDEEDLTERDRAKVQRRAERHIRRQRREAAASRAALIASSQAPAIAVASQPASVHGGEGVRPLGEALAAQSFSGALVESSQTTAPAAVAGAVMPASQIVPGRFGGRPPPRKKAKRKQGF